MISIVDFKKAVNETQLQYVWRLCSAKDSGELDIGWVELAEILNRELYGDDKSRYCTESCYRKKYQISKQALDEVFSQNGMTDGYIEDLRNARHDLYKERVKLQDERNELNRKLREQARKENIVDLMKNSIAQDVRPYDIEQYKGQGGLTEMVVCLSDLHAGLVSNNIMNDYNPKVLTERLEYYAARIIMIQETHHANVCHVCLLGDMISGFIHNSIRLENALNTIEQIKFVSECIGEFIRVISPYFSSVEVYSVAGNHGRITAKKEDHLSGEELDLLVMFYLNTAFRNAHDVHIHEGNVYGEYVAAFNVLKEWRFMAVHGDNDSMNTVTKNMIAISGSVPDVILMGHMHHSAVDTDGRTKIIMSGCVSGTDSYAFNKRLFSPPEQTVIVASDKSPTEAIYIINLE